MGPKREKKRVQTRNMFAILRLVFPVRSTFSMLQDTGCGPRGVEPCTIAAEGVDFTVSQEICQDPIGSAEHNACVAAGYTARDAV